jgi:hypothetical protein
LRSASSRTRRSRVCRDGGMTRRVCRAPPIVGPHRKETVMIVYILIAVIVLVLVAAALSVRVIKQYERVVLFELGKVKDGARGPGIMFIVTRL